jgi:NAD(P)-dependent dehydrogenase (short-subunit alcohol dehydrogenase family)
MAVKGRTELNPETTVGELLKVGKEAHAELWYLFGQLGGNLIIPAKTTLRDLRKMAKSRDMRKRARENKPDDQRISGPLHGKVAVVTGASRGIGLAIATALAARGCDLALMARDVTKLREIAHKLARGTGVRVVVKSCDVRDAGAVQDFFHAFRRRFKRLDYLINNAGVAHALAPVQILDPLQWTNVIATNLHGTFLCTHFALPLMQEGGAIVNNLSVAATNFFPGAAGYNASKWGALGLTNTLREELRPRRIRVIALIPGPTDTEIWNQFMPQMAHSERMMSADTIAQAVVDALSLPDKAVVEELKIRPITGSI